MDLKVYSDLKASLKKLHITAAKDVDYSGGNKTVVVIFLLVFKPAKAFGLPEQKLQTRFVFQDEDSIHI